MEADAPGATARNRERMRQITFVFFQPAGVGLSE